ncbi:MAG: translocation/assembly module TamB domain-containing protein [Pararhizobium sp.]
MIRIVLLLVALLLAPFSAVAAHAQANDDADKSALTRFVESKLSSENRRISLNGIKGALSSNASIDEITVADHAGVWLRIVNARIVWTRTSLLFGRLEIDSLGADRIEVLRKPLPKEGAPAPESSGFSLPKLPVSVTLKQLDVPEVDFGPTVFGLASKVSLTGGLKLADGVLDTKLAIKRLDGPGGTLSLAASYADSTKVLDLNLQVDEPKNGILANLLNIQGRPAVALSLKGSGPVDDLTLDLALDTDGERALTGRTTLKRGSAGLMVDADLHGPIARLVAPVFRDFFGSNTQLTVNALVKNGGGFRVDRLSLKGGALALEAKAETTADKFLKSLTLDAKIADANGAPVTLPVPGGTTKVGSAAFTVDFGNTGSDRWNGAFTVDRLDTATLDAKAVKLTLGGLATGLENPDARHVTFDVSGGVSGISTKNPDVRKALGDRIDLAIRGGWKSGAPVDLTTAAIKANGLSLDLAGTIAKLVFNGTIDVKAASLAPFAALANRPLAGALDLKAKGTVQPTSGAFDLTFDGSGRNLETGNAALDRLLASDVALAGRLARTTTGFEASGFEIRNQQVDIKANGVYSTDKADFDLDLALADLGLVTDRASGRVTAKATVRGNSQSMALALNAAVPSGTLGTRKLADAAIFFDGNLLGIDATAGHPYGTGVSGRIRASAFLSGERVSLVSAVLATPEEKKLTGLSFQAGGTTLTGTLDRNAAGLIEGALKLDAPDISTAAALAALDAKGSAEATIDLSRENGMQSATIDGTLSGISVKGATIGKAAIKASIADLFGVPKVDGTLEGSDITAGGIAIRILQANAKRTGPRTAFDASAALKNGTTLSTAGSLADTGKGFDIGLDRLDLKQGATTAHLVEPAAIAVEGQTVRIAKPLTLDIGGGHVQASGSVGDTLDLKLAIDKLPLSIANTIKPDLAAGGTISGTADVSGARSKPQVAFDLSAKGATAKPLKAAGLPPIDLTAKGRTVNERIDIDAKLTAAGGINVAAVGSVPAGSSGNIDLTVTLDRFPLATLDRMAKGQAPKGTLSAKAKIGGTLKAPTATFTANGSAVSAAPLAKFGVSPLSLDVAGSYAGSTVSLKSAKVTNGQGLSVSASGTVPLKGAGLSVRVEGNAPLGLANRALAERGTRIDGTVQFSLNATGTIGHPVISGMLSTSNANVVDPSSNVRFNGISILASIRDNRVTFNRFNAPLASGGTIAIGGSLSLDAAADFPVDMTITLNQARYSNGEFIAATASGRLTVTGHALRDPVIGGRITLERAEIGIPDRLGSGVALTDVVHIHTPPDVEATLNRARIKAGGKPVPTARPSVVQLDLTIDAPRRIFVRGRGLDAEMGGRLRVRGPITDVHPVGGFDLIRGRLEILGKRIDFDTGTITLTGSLDPTLNLSAHSDTGNTTITITVTGRASDPQINFSSQPALPQDEVLAQLIFGRSVSDLSGFQVAELAAAVAELAGGQNTSIVGKLRQATGLDDLDVGTDANGQAQVRAGRYIRDNVYLGVEAGASGNSQVDLNLDITKNLKAKAAAGTKGDSNIGLFYERDY